MNIKCPLCGFYCTPMALLHQSFVFHPTFASDISRPVDERDLAAHLYEQHGFNLLDVACGCGFQINMVELSKRLDRYAEHLRGCQDPDEHIRLTALGEG